MNAQHQPWRTERRIIDGKPCTLVVTGYGSSARYMTDDSGRPRQFTAAQARAAIAAIAAATGGQS